MKRIFISTNHDLHGLFNYRGYETQKSQLDCSQLTLLAANNVLYYNNATKKFDTTTVSSNIIIIKDSYPSSIRDTPNIFFNDIDINSDCLLHHDREEYHKTFILSKFTHKKAGQHTAGNENLFFYEKVFKIIFDDKDDKFNRILTALEFTDKQIQKKDKLEAFIHLHKSLKLLPLKGNWSEDSFKKAKENLENTDSINLAKDKLNNISFVKDIDEYYKQLEPIETEILNLSTTK